jgi:hypothetical protein
MNEVSWFELKLFPMYKFMGRFFAIFPTMTMILILKRELSGCDTVLDLYCGHHSLIQHCNIPFTVGVELFDRSLQESKRKGIHNEYIKADIRELEFKPKSFDAVIAIEVLEHLTKKEGYELINRMEHWARKRVTLITPNEYFWQDDYYDNPLQEYKSSWSVEELRKLKYKVHGINGWKRLRGDKGYIIYKPTLLWGIISALTQKVTYYYPKLAFQLMASKRTDGVD